MALPLLQRRGLRRALIAWSLFAGACAAFGTFEWGVFAAAERADAMETDLVRRSFQLEARLQSYAYRDSIPELEQRYNAGRPFPRGEIDLDSGHVERIVVPGERIDPNCAGWDAVIDYSTTPGSIWNRVRAIPPRRKLTLVDRLGDLEVRRFAEQLRRLVLVLCAGVWAVAMAPAPVAGPARRMLGQVAAAAALLALLAWGADTARLSLWALPRMNWISAAGLGGLFIAIVSAVVPARRRRPVPDRCAACGYNLRDNVSGVCPECGRPTPAEARRRRDAELAPLADALVQAGDAEAAAEDLQPEPELAPYAA